MGQGDRRLLDAFLHRDRQSLDEEIRAFWRSDGPKRAAASVLRLSTLACTPSVHGRCAWLCAISAFESVERGAEILDQLVESAVYSSETRSPWSEPPVASIPDPETFTTEQVIEILSGDDRSAAERWIAGIAGGDHDQLREVGALLDGPEGWGAVMTAAGLRVCARFPAATHYQILLNVLDDLLGSERMDGGAVEPAAQSFLASRDPAALLRFESMIWREWLNDSGEPRDPVSFPAYHYGADFGSRPRLSAALAHSRIGGEIAEELEKVVASRPEEGETWEDWSLA